MFQNILGYVLPSENNCLRVCLYFRLSVSLTLSLSLYMSIYIHNIYICMHKYEYVPNTSHIHALMHAHTHNMITRYLRPKPSIQRGCGRRAFRLGCTDFPPGQVKGRESTSLKRGAKIFSLSFLFFSVSALPFLSPFGNRRVYSPKREPVIQCRSRACY